MEEQVLLACMLAPGLPPLLLHSPLWMWLLCCRRCRR